MNGVDSHTAYIQCVLMNLAGKTASLQFRTWTSCILSFPAIYSCVCSFEERSYLFAQKQLLFLFWWMTMNAFLYIALSFGCTYKILIWAVKLHVIVVIIQLFYVLNELFTSRNITCYYYNLRYPWNSKSISAVGTYTWENLGIDWIIWKSSWKMYIFFT